MKVFRVNFLIFLGFLLVICSSPILAHDNYDDIVQTYYRWVRAVEHAQGNPDDVVKLYAHDAVLLATFSPKILFNKDQGHNPYFTAFTSKAGLKCKTKRIIIRRYGNVAINTGFYTFTYKDSDGSKVIVPARYTFVYRKINGQWLIENHHSSVLPQDHPA